MIEFLRGRIYSKTFNSLTLDVKGVGYSCFITKNTYDRLPSKGEECLIITYFQVTENSQSLFGFYDEKEKTFFELLIGVSGIGPKTAINLLSSISPDEFKDRIISGEVSKLKLLPGIGAKSAKRIIVELKDKLIKVDENDLPQDDDFSNKNYKDAFDALMALGYKSSDFKDLLIETINKEKDLDIQSLIKKILNKLN